MSAAKKITLWILILSPLTFGLSQLFVSFDKTEIIDLKNEDTIRGSCMWVAARLPTATNTLSMQIMRSSRDNPQERKFLNEAQAIREFGESAARWSAELELNDKYLPPSLRAEFTTKHMEARLRFDQAIAHDPRMGVKIYHYCRQKYGFDVQKTSHFENCPDHVPGRKAPCEENLFKYFLYSIRDFSRCDMRRLC